MELEYLGHSCFKLTSDNFTIVLDPYAPSSVPGLEDLALTANLVLCSHTHADHGCSSAVKVVYKECNPCRITQLKCFHDDDNGNKRGQNIIHIIENENLRVAHFGDIGHALSETLVKELGRIDVALLPVGGYYTVDATVAHKIVEALNPKTVIPMHYRTTTTGYDEIATVKPFIEYFEDVEYDGSKIELIGDLPKVIVMKQKSANKV